MTFMLLLMTIRSHFATNVERVSTQSSTMEAAETDNILPLLTAENIACILQIDRVAEDDGIRLQQMQDIDDDMQSQYDQAIAERERHEEENEDPQALFEIRRLTRTIDDDWDDEGRAAEARERQERRQEQDRPRHQGTLHQHYQALHQQVMTARRARLEAAQRRE
eukprot:657073-Amphidinium_carterae.1